MLADKVREILKDKCGLNRITDDATLDWDLGLDALDFVEVAVALEKELRINLPNDIIDANFATGMTFADFVRKIEDCMPIRHVETPVSQTQDPIAGLYTMRNGVPMCCLTGDKCKKLSKNEIKQNTGLYNLCRRRACVIESNFQRLAQKVK